MRGVECPGPHPGLSGAGDKRAPPARVPRLATSTRARASASASPAPRPARILLRPMTVVSTGRTPLDLTPLRRSAAVILMAPLLATASPQSPPSPAPPERQVPTFGISTELVYVRFHVEKKGGYLDALKPDQIRVLEDGQPQKIALLETPATRERTVPPEVTLALDVSSSVMD